MTTLHFPLDRVARLFITALFCIALSATALAQTSSFTYQGRFTDGGTAANGTYDMQFKLYDSPSVGAGSQVGSTITNGAVTVSSGVFTGPLDFGAAGVLGADPGFLNCVRAFGRCNLYT